MNDYLVPLSRSETLKLGGNRTNLHRQSGRVFVKYNIYDG